MIDVSGRWTSAPTDDSLRALVAGEQQLGLVGDRDVGLARPPASFSGAPGPTASAMLHVEPGLAELARGLRGVDAGVVGVGQVVEHQRDRWARGARPWSSLLLAAGGERSATADGAAAQDGAAERRVTGRGPFGGWAHGASRRSASASSGEERDGEHGEQDDDGGVGARGLELRDRLHASGGRGPRSEPAYSAKTAPITAIATAIFAPVSAAGSAAGASTKRNACQRDASSVRISLRCSGSTAASASSVVTTTGKKQTSATIDELRARCRSRTRRPAAARRSTIGIACERDEQRVERRGAAAAERCSASASADARATSASEQPEDDLLGGHERSCPTAGRGRRHSALSDLGRRGQDEGVDAPSAAYAPSRRAARASEQRGGTSASRLSSAAQRSARAHGDDRGVGAPVAAGGGRPAMSATTRPGRGDSTTTRSASSAASSTSWVTSSTVRGSRARAPRQPRLQLGARDARPARRTARRGRARARRPAACAGTRRAGACRRESSPGRARSKPAEAERAEQRRARARGPARAAAPGDAQRQRRVVERVEPRQQQVALGHEHGARPRRARSRRRAPAGRRRAPAASTCRSRWGRRRRRPRRRATRSVSRRARRRRRPRPEHARDGRRPRRRCVLRGSGAASLRASVDASLPPRALPHRFEGSAPGMGAISAGLRQLPWSLHADGG